MIPRRTLNEKTILSKEENYSFADYFKLVAYAEDLLEYFGYAFRRENLTLPQSSLALTRLEDIKLRLEENLPYISMTSEAARREFLLAPVLMEVVHYTHTQVRVEFPLTVTAQLKGVIDYYLHSPQQQLLIIEAKNGELERGFVQLASELVAFDQWTESDVSQIYGAVSTGSIWQFGKLERSAKLVVQDVNLFRVPADVEEVLRVLIAILNGES